MFKNSELLLYPLYRNYLKNKFIKAHIDMLSDIKVKRVLLKPQVSGPNSTNDYVGGLDPIALGFQSMIYLFFVVCKLLHKNKDVCSMRRKN